MEKGKEGTKGKSNIIEIYNVCLELLKKNENIFRRKDVYPLIDIPQITISEKL